MTPSPTKAGRWRKAGRLALWFAAALGLAALLLAAAGYVILTTDAGARLAWRSAVLSVPGKLSGEVIGGTVDGGLVLRNVVYANQGLRIAIDRAEARWELQRTPLGMQIFFVRAGHADLSLPSGGETPPAVPARLTLPFALRVDQFAVNTLAIHREGKADRFSDVRLHGASTGVRHTLVLEHANTPYGSVAARLTLNGLPPFELGGNGVLNVEHGAQAYRVDATLAGTLAAPDIGLTVHGAPFDADAKIGLAPFATPALRIIEAAAAHLNPARLRAGWPQADLSLRLSLAPGGTAGGAAAAVGGSLQIKNLQAGTFDAGRIPLADARAAISIGPQHTAFSGIEVRLHGGARIEGSATLDQDGHGPLRLQVRGLNLEALHSGLIASQLNGPVRVDLRARSQRVNVALNQGTLGLAADMLVSDERVILRWARLSEGGSRVDLAATLERAGNHAFTASGSLANVNPATLATALSTRRANTAARNIPSARINGRFTADGAIGPDRRARLRFEVADSSYNGLPMRGAGVLALTGANRVAADARVEIAGNSAEMRGNFGAQSDTLSFTIDAPSLDRLGFGVAGALTADGTLGGSLERPVIDARLNARDLALGAYRVARISAQASGLGLAPWAAQQTVSLALTAQGLRSPAAAIAAASARVSGTYGQHTVDARMQGNIHGQPVQLSVTAAGALQQHRQGIGWQGQIRALENAAPPQVALASPLAVSVAPGQIALGAGRVRIARATVDVSEFVYRDGLIRTAGTVTALDLGHVLALRTQLTGQAAPVSGNLLLDGHWSLTLGATDGDGVLQLRRRSGDLRTGAGVALGVRAFSFDATLAQNRLSLAVSVDTARFGTAGGQAQVLMRRAGGQLAPLPDSPITGTLRASIPQLQAIGAMAGPRIALAGSAQAALTIGGTLGDVRLGGNVAGEGLAMTLYDYGLRLRDGSVRLTLSNDVVEIERALFRAGDGTLRASGRLALDGQAAKPAPVIVAEKLQVLSGPRGTLTLSGKASARRIDGALAVTGAFVVDRARLTLPDQAAPRLGGDVVVRRGGQVQNTGLSPPWSGPAGALGPHVRLNIDLGGDFRFVGGGADMLLAGTLAVQRTPTAPLQVEGTVNVVEGTYEAFGTTLAIERGTINFQGRPDNPNVNIHAYRRGEEVETGVIVTGTVQRPRAQLVSEPDVSEAEKLSWLVFGHRPGEGAGRASAVAQSAGIGLLNRFVGSQAATSLGLEQLGIGTSAVGIEGGQVLNIGKEISDRLYVAYEQSISGGGSVLMLTYELSQFWSAVLFGGTVSGAELRYSRRFDRLRAGPVYFERALNEMRAQQEESVPDVGAASKVRHDE